MFEQNTSSYCGNIIFTLKKRNLDIFELFELIQVATHGRNILRFNTNIGAKV